MLLQIDHTELRPGVNVIKLTGKVMLGPESQQIEALTAELIAKGQRAFVFDVSQVSHIDSTGIGRFISSFNMVREAGGLLRMAGAVGQLREGFKATRLDTVFPFYPDVDSACEGL